MEVSSISGDTTSAYLYVTKSQHLDSQNSTTTISSNIAKHQDCLRLYEDDNLREQIRVHGTQKKLQHCWRILMLSLQVFQGKSPSDCSRTIEARHRNIYNLLLSFIQAQGECCENITNYKAS
ncbi:Uncharacterized protein Fot_00168 [Forsythia ovata]|uniref:Uncharacterized protein n=1 Tax=Forsythia ovata TaxID=205694 RepID=A0ABD1X0H0_9LAMI